MAPTLTVNPENVFLFHDPLRQSDLPYVTSLALDPVLLIESLVEQSAFGRMILILTEHETTLDTLKSDMKTIPLAVSGIRLGALMISIGLNAPIPGYATMIEVLADDNETRSQEPGVGLLYE